MTTQLPKREARHLRTPERSSAKQEALGVSRGRGPQESAEKNARRHSTRGKVHRTKYEFFARYNDTPRGLRRRALFWRSLGPMESPVAVKAAGPARPFMNFTRMSNFTLIRSRIVRRILLEIDISKSSGPHDLPGNFFKEFAAELAIPISLLIRFLLRHTFWPDFWREHRIHPLFKKGISSSPGNYREIHLTNILAKICERVVGHILILYFERVSAFRISQFGFRAGHSFKDLVLLLTTRWLWALDQGFKIGVYLSDISGAFDRADRNILM